MMVLLSMTVRLLLAAADDVARGLRWCLGLLPHRRRVALLVRLLVRPSCPLLVSLPPLLPGMVGAILRPCPGASLD